MLFTLIPAAWVGYMPAHIARHASAGQLLLLASAAAGYLVLAAVIVPARLATLRVGKPLRGVRLKLKDKNRNSRSRTDHSPNREQCDVSRRCGNSSPLNTEATASCYRVKLTVMVVRTGTGTPFSSVGMYSHCRMASSAA